MIKVFDLGIQPLANDFAASKEDRHGYAPLEVMLCPRCNLAQLSVVVRPDILYSRYPYVTSQSHTMRQHFNALGESLSSMVPFSTMLEIGSNDGTLLRHFMTLGIKVAGIDPAENLAEQARKIGVPTVAGVFNSDSAQKATDGFCQGFDVILARHVFCHVDDWREFIDCLVIPSHRNTLVCIEVPYVQDLLSRGEFDTIYHEHLSYLNLQSVCALLEGSPFRLNDVIRFPIHGGAICLILRRRDCSDAPNAELEEMVHNEECGVSSWKDFSCKASANIESLSRFVHDAVQQNKRVCGYGASAKSTVWVNACKFKRQHIGFIADSTIQKWYKISPGTDIPVTDEGAILRELPDYAICFAWNFRDEILKKNELARSKGVKFVFPIPSLEVV